MTPPLDVALVNGRVHTLGQAMTDATAIGIAGDTIVTIGDDAAVRAQAHARTDIIDLDGAVALPGIIDSHLHPLQGALLTRGVDLGAARTLDEVRRLVAEEHARTNGEVWVLGHGLRYAAFDGIEINGRLLEDAAGGAPALFTMEDIHSELVTPRALELAGVRKGREYAEEVDVLVDAYGAPTGVLREMAAIRLVRQAMPPLTDAERVRLYAAQLRRFAAAGITGAHGMDGTPATLDAVRELEAGGELVTRLVMSFWSHPDTPEEAWEEHARHRDARGERWRAGVAKLFIDGIIETGTGWLFEPDSEGEGTEPLWGDYGKFLRAVEFFAARGFQVATHACGDRAVHETLNAYRSAGAAPGVRHRIEHVEVLRPDDRPRFAAEGVVASMQPQHMIDLSPDRSDAFSRRLGPERCDHVYPIRSLLASGAVVALGSDWPVVAFDWREGMAAAQLRRSPAYPERAAYDDQGIDALSALRGYTSGAALAVGDHERLGRLAPGFLADITVVAEDPVHVAPDDLVDLPVLATLVGGQVVHRAG